MKKALVLLTSIIFLAGCSKGQEQAQAPVAAPAAEQQVASVATPPMIVSGMGHLRKGEIREAIQSFDEAIKANPKDVQGYLILGQTYMHLKEYNRAIDTLTVATQVDPNNGQAHYLLATNFGLAGNFSMARFQAQKCVEIFRQNQDEENFKRSVALLQGLPAAEMPQAQ